MNKRIRAQRGNGTVAVATSAQGSGDTAVDVNCRAPLALDSPNHEGAVND
jgi:hypothetical protein